MQGLPEIYWGLGVTVVGVGLRWLWPSVPRSVAWGVLATGLALLALGAASSRVEVLAWVPPALAIGIGLCTAILHYLIAGRKGSTMSENDEDPEGPAGIVMNDCENMNFSETRIGGYDTAIRAKRNKQVTFDNLEIDRESKAPPRKSFGGYSFGKGDHLKK